MRDTIKSFIKLPTPDDLPDHGATLADYIRFGDRFNPMLQSKEQFLKDSELREHYREYVNEIWGECVAQYKEGKAFSNDAKELLLCMGYDVALGPYLGVPESEKIRFYTELVAAIRSVCENSD